MPESQQARQPLHAAAVRWRDRCLLADGSALTDESVWTGGNVAQLVRYFVENLDYGKGDFFSKLKGQLAPADPGAKKLAAEMLWVIYLVVHESAMQAVTKRLQIEQVWTWSGEPAPESEMLGEVLAAGVANPGTAYHTHRWRELVFIIRLMERWKPLPENQKQGLLRDRWAFAEWMDSLEDSRARQLRHALLYLLFPSAFDPIVTLRHKRSIVERWHEEAGIDTGELDFSNRLAVDRALHQIRTYLEERSSSGRINFYDEPWESQWRRRAGSSEAGDKEGDAADEEEVEQFARDTFGGARVWLMAAGGRGQMKRGAGIAR